MLFLIASFVGFSFGQTATGTFTGTVTDPKGLSMTNVNVVVRNMDTGINHLVTSNEAGVYVAPLLQPGNYSLTVTKEGFAKMERMGVMLMVGQTLTIDFQMSLEAQQQVITVTEQTPLIETSKTEQAQAVTENLVSNLPINGRRWEDFVFLTPGVTTDGTAGLSSFRGISSLYNGNSVDGANNTQAFFSEARGRAIIVSYVYSADSIKEFQVNNSNFNAEYGQAAGGVVNAVTKSGGNQYHGDLFYNLRYPTLNALDPVAEASAISNHTVATQTVHQQQQFGGSVGGPILKDKLFFFVTGDGFRKVNPIQYTTTQTNPSIGALTCPLQVTAGECGIAKNFLLGELGAFQRDLVQNVGFAKLDYQLNDKNHLSVLANLQDWQEPFGYNTSPTVSNGGAGNNGFGATHERFVIANWNTTISNDKLNELRFQWARDFEFDTANEPGPFVSLSNIESYGETSALPRPAFPDEHRYELSDNFSFIKGAHTFKTGVDINFVHDLLINLFQGDGSYSYSGVALPAAAGCPGNTQNTIFCDWMIDSLGLDIPGDTRAVGQHYTSFTQVTDPITHVGSDDFFDRDYGVYFQDSWRVRPNLTLNLGLRYDIQHVPAPPAPNTATPLLSLYTSTLHIDKGDVAPRIGVAWSFAKNTVLRVSAGSFYAKTSNSTYYALRVENGIYQQTISGCAPGASSAALKACAPIFPNVFFVPPGPGLAAPFAGALTPGVVLPAGGLPSSSAAVHGMDPNFVNPRVEEGEVTLERELPWGMSFSGSYLLTRGLRLPWNVDSNVAPSSLTKSYDVLAGPASPAQTVTVPFYTTRLNPTTGIIQTQYSVVSSWYNAMVLTVRKPVTHQLELLANYTLASDKDNGETAGSNGTFFGNDGVLDPYNRAGDYSRSDLYQRNRFVGSAVWTPSYGSKFSNKMARQAIQGWTVSGILTAASGQPYSGLISTSTFGNGGVDGGMTGGVIGTSASNSGGRASWLPRNSFTLPSWTNFDFSVARTITIRERLGLELRADAFNLFNNTIVLGVNTTAYSFSAAGSGACAGHVNGCMIPNASFQNITTTSGSLYGARQLQFGARLNF
jgi:outer membrane receptor protein involved in Fe transport